MAKKSREISYLNKDFTQFRDNLIRYIKTYFKDTISDFSPNDPAMMFLEMSSYVGDTLSFYIDRQLKESFLLHAQDRKNIFALAQSLGYKPIPKTPAVTSLDVYQLIPAIGTGINAAPDWRYALKINKGMQVQSNESNIIFRSKEDVDFGVSNTTFPRDVSVYQVDGSGNPTFYLVKKNVQIESGEEKTFTFTIGDPERYLKLLLPDADVIYIINITDSNGNLWYEVPYLAQNTLLKSTKNTAAVNLGGENDYDKSPYVLSWVEIPKRFVTRYRNDYKLEMQFGGGLTDREDPQEIVPNPYNIGMTTSFGRSSINDFFDQTNFISNDSYGEVPANTILTVKYLVGGGISANVLSDTITKINNIETEIESSGLDQSLLNSVLNSVAVNNPEPARGGRDEMTEEEIRHNALASFASQFRAVTSEDYTVRSLSMPAKFGSISKVFVQRVDESLSSEELLQKENVSNSEDATTEGESSLQRLLSAINRYVGRVNGGTLTPLFATRMLDIIQAESLDIAESLTTLNEKANEGQRLIESLEEKITSEGINLYVLSYDDNKRLMPANSTVKNNLKKYLRGFKMLTDTLNIIDAFIVNIRVDFTITILPEYNSNEVLLKCIDGLKQYFNIDNWNVNQPIVRADIIKILANTEGVQSVIEINLTGLDNTSFSDIHGSYDLVEAYDEEKQIWYPSLDPMCFEVRDLDTDIKGKVVSY